MVVAFVTLDGLGRVVELVCYITHTMSPILTILLAICNADCGGRYCTVPGTTCDCGISINTTKRAGGSFLNGSLHAQISTTDL